MLLLSLILFGLGTLLGIAEFFKPSGLTPLAIACISGGLFCRFFGGA